MKNKLTRLPKDWATSVYSEVIVIHTPVLLTEVIQYLNPQPGKNFIDATADGGGHTTAILKTIQPSGRILAVEWDEELFEELKNKLNRECPDSKKNYELALASYTDLAKLVKSLKFAPVHGILFDFGMSSHHLESPRRGFSFQKDEDLDMRYSRESRETAADILARCSREELEKIFKEYGEERFAGKIAAEVVAARRKTRIQRTGGLVAIIRKATPRWYQKSRLHFAAKVFQALRIAVNRELENIGEGLEAAAKIVAPSGRVVAISFHSLEDRIVKNFFRRGDIKKIFKTLAKKPIYPSREEIKANPRARSARLRAFEKQTAL